MNIFEKCPILENEKFFIRLFQMDDCDDLLKVYSDKNALPFFNSDGCDGDNFYYRQKKLSFTKMEDVQKRAQQAVKKGKPLIFHWRGGGLSKDVFQELMQAVEQEASKKELHSKVSVNVPQAVFYITFQSNASMQEIIEEHVEADGEVVSEEPLSE